MEKVKGLSDNPTTGARCATPGCGLPSDHLYHKVGRTPYHAFAAPAPSEEECEHNGECEHYPVARKRLLAPAPREERCAWRCQMKGYTIGCTLPAGHHINSDGGPHQSLCDGPFYVKASAPALAPAPSERCFACLSPGDGYKHKPGCESYAALRAEVERLRGLLREAWEAECGCFGKDLYGRIDAALATEGKK